MLKRADGEYLLTKEIYDKARKGDLIPPYVNFYDGESNIHIYRVSGENAKYCRGHSFLGLIGYVNEHTIEEIRAMCMPNDQPLPSEEVEASTTLTPEVSLAESKLDEILRRLAKLEQKADFLVRNVHTSHTPHTPAVPVINRHPFITG